MSEHDDELPQLDAEVARLFANEAKRPGPDALLQARVTAALLASIGAGAAAVPTAGAQAPVPNLPIHPTPSGIRVSSTVAATGAALTRGQKILPLLTLMLGMGAGAILHAVASDPPATRVETVIREVRVEVPVPMPAEPAPLVRVEPTPAREVEPPSASRADAAVPQDRNRPRATPEEAPRPDTQLAEESALIARAQMALSRGASPQALDALRLHGKQFARGQLVEEREALWVQALVAAGQTDAARARAKDFARRYPTSPLREAVDSALESAP